MVNRTWYILFAILLVACTSSAPQRPSQRKSRSPEPDSAELALMELNYRLAQAADEQLAQLVKEQDERYALYDGSAWMHIFSLGDEHTSSPLPNEEWLIHMRVMNLEGRLLEDSEQTYRIQRHELPYAVDRNIDILHHGAHARIYAPWYSAFGIQGTANIPPYENVIIEIELR